MLPGRGAGSWLGAPLLPWRVQCPVRVCAALAAGLGGRGWRQVLCLLRCPSPAPRSPRCVWRVVPSGGPVPSAAGTPFLAVCAFRGLCPVALLVFPVCPLRVCALVLSRRPRPFSLPGSVCHAHLAWLRCRAPVEPFHAVRAPPRVLPRSVRCLACLGGGVAPSRSPFAWHGVVCPLLNRPARPGRSGAGGGGGGGGLCAVLPKGVAGGPRGVGGRSTLVRPSAFPGRPPKRVLLASLSSWRAWPPYCSDSCSRVDPGCGPCGALVCWHGSACLARSLWERAGGGVGAHGVLP